jgi:hypothetical protein
MTVRRIELVGRWDDDDHYVKTHVDTTGKFIIMPVADAEYLAAMANGNYPRVIQELRCALGESSHEHEWRQQR